MRWGLALPLLLLGCQEGYEPTPRAPRSDFEGLPPVARLDEGVDWSLRPPKPKDAEVDGGEGLDATLDAAQDAAPEDMAVEDALPPDASRRCQMDRECALAFDLHACDPCPIAATVERLEMDDCLAPYEVLDELPSEVEGCPRSCEPSLCPQPAFEAVCFDGACIGVGGL